MNEITRKTSRVASTRPQVTDPVARAMALHQRALRLEEEYKYDESIACLIKAVTLAPQVPIIRLELGLFLLRRGEFGPGLLEYEWRWRLKERVENLPKFRVPRWNGMRLPHGRIALVGDQGAGDKIQFVRYIPMVAERCKEVYLLSPPATSSLFSGYPGLAGVATKLASLPPVDVFCPLSSLPFVFGTTLETIPGGIPYLQADSEKAAVWKERLDQKCPTGNLRVGISWAGSPAHVKDRWRSTRLDQWEELLNIESVSFISLQKQIPEVDQIHLSSQDRLIDFTADIGDFSDTAALIESLDLVIAVDTSVVHLAGALGKPAWVLLQWVPDWRWLLEREDSPWYPTLRIFRQEVRDDYSRPLQRITDNLRKVASTGGRLKSC